MNQSGLYPSTLIFAAQGLRIDVATAEIAQTFDVEDIETVVLTGPVLADGQG